jgi:hypothetical protein
VGESASGKDYALELAEADLAIEDYYQVTVR